jgi:hypothetical protein
VDGTGSGSWSIARFIMKRFELGVLELVQQV